MQKNLTKFAAIIGVAAMLVPAMVSAHGLNAKTENQTTNQFGVQIFGSNSNANTNVNSNTSTKANRDTDSDSDSDNDKAIQKRDDRNLRLFGKDFEHGFMPNLFYNGKVTATSSTGFTLTTKNGSVFTINDGSAKIVVLPSKVGGASDIKVGDSVHVTGVKTVNGSTTINASVVYVLPQNLQPAAAKGTVTAVNGNTITLQTKSDGTAITVNTDANTAIVDNTNGNHNTNATQADVKVGMTAKLVGLWDSVLNVFNAVKIKLL